MNSPNGSRRWTRRARWRTRLLVAVGVLVVVVVLGYVVAWLVVEPAGPGDFYTAPAEIDEQPGVLLRSEPVDTDVQDADAYRILYSSRDPDGQPTAVSGLALVPRAPAPAAGYPVVAWAHGTTGVARHCAPSLTPDTTGRNLAGAQQLIDAGYLVVGTDYPGLGTEGPHPYLIGRAEAHAVLDSIRAVHSDPGWHAGPSAVVWGHSQGGHAALFTAQYAPSYAPEVEVLGIATAAPAADLSVLLRHDITEPAGKVFGGMALASWSRLYPDAELSEIVRRRDLPQVEAVAAACIVTRDQGLVLLPEVSLMSDQILARDPTTTEPWSNIIRDNTVEPKGIDVPLFVAQGTADTVIPPAVTQDWVRRMCGENPSVTYREYAGKDHLSVLPAATPDVLAWIGDRLAGRPPPTGCHLPDP